MPINTTLMKLMTAAALLTLCNLTIAGEPISFGEYTVHYNAFNTDTLQPGMAEAYNIVRSKNRGMVTISVIKKVASNVSPLGKPVRASVTVSASNLTGQYREFKVREIDEGSSIYYLSEFHVAHEEILNFVVNILPEGSVKSFTVEFRQKFYTQ